MTIHTAAAQNAEWKIRRLLEEGVPVDALSQPTGDNRGGLTPLCVAAGRGSYAAARMLLECGADPNIQCRDWSAFDMACRQGDIRLVRLMIQHGAKPKGTDQNGFTPLHHAAVCGKLQVVKFLVEEYGVDVNAKTHYSQEVMSETPLDLALYHKHTRTAASLRAHGATESKKQ